MVEESPGKASNQAINHQTKKGHVKDKVLFSAGLGGYLVLWSLI